MANCRQACPYNTLTGCKADKYNAVCPLDLMSGQIYTNEIQDMKDEIKELRADNERLCEMWAKAVSDLSKCNTEKMEYKRMLDNAYEIIGKMTDRWG